jgi:hypothetical protein
VRNNDKILFKIGLVNSINDTSNLDWYEGYEKINEEEEIIKLLSEFCDNTLFYFIDELSLTIEDGRYNQCCRMGRGVNQVKKI